MTKIKHIFFDLDHTLWDFEQNAQDTLQELFIIFKLKDVLNTSVDTFINYFMEVNYALWKKYDTKELSKEELRKIRCILVLANFNVKNDILAEKIETNYLKMCPQKNTLFPYAIEILEYLQEKYILHILTNGFELTQLQKIKASNLSPFFEHIITSECSNYCKPHEKMFEFALEKTTATIENSIMIGDNLISDIQGANQMGMKTIHFDQKNDFSENSINCLSQLKKLL